MTAPTHASKDEMLGALKRVGSSRFVSWATVDPETLTDDEIDAHGVVDFQNHRMRAMHATIAPAVLRHTQSSPGLLGRVVKPVMRYGAKPRDTFQDGENLWYCSNGAWHRDPRRKEPLPGWSVYGPMFMLESLARLTTIMHAADQEQVRDVDTQVLDARADLTAYLAGGWRERPSWATSSNREFLSRVEVKLWLDDRGLLRRASAAPFPAEGRNPVFWRHIEYYDFGAVLETPDLPTPTSQPGGS